MQKRPKIVAIINFAFYWPPEVMLVLPIA